MARQGEPMGNEEKQQKYDEYINGVSPMAAAIGQRVPYHLEYLRRHGAGPVPGKGPDMGRDGSTGQQDCRKWGT